MKKPVMPKGAELDAIVAKRKHAMLTITKTVPIGTLAQVIEAVEKFATDNGVTPEEVKFGREYGTPVIKVRRRETDEEKFRRVRDNEYWKVQSKLYDYNRWKRQEDERAAREKAALESSVKDVQKAIDNGTLKVKCDHQCGCK